MFITSRMRRENPKAAAIETRLLGQAKALTATANSLPAQIDRVPPELLGSKAGM
jgi:hypothetical protein